MTEDNNHQRDVSSGLMGEAEDFCVRVGNFSLKRWEKKKNRMFLNPSLLPSLEILQRPVHYQSLYQPECNHHPHHSCLSLMTEVIVLPYDNKLQTGVSIVTDLSHVEESELSLLFSPESSLIDHKWSSGSFMCYVSPPSVPWAFDHFLTPLQKICKNHNERDKKGDC